VPYGEVVPFRGIVRFLSYPWGDEDISEGRTIEPFSFAGHKLGVQVCYDNQFGFISRSSARQGAEALLLVTNNSWYDLPSGIRQHCDIDQLRAIETRRALGRSSTTGWTQLVLPSGRIAASSKLNKQDMVEQWLPLSTAQSVYSITGDIFAQLCAVAGMVLGAGVVLAGRSEGWL
jgi:apolipoprotein N-acyltransferase